MPSPYLIPNRLPDVLAAIQVMGSHFWDSREMKHWMENLGAKPQSADSWDEVFAAHPEFFGRDTVKDGRTLHVLRLRRSFENTIDEKTRAEVSADEIERLKQADEYQKTRKLSRPRLQASQDEALMKTAIELQVRAAALADRRRFWATLTVPAVTGLFGGALGYLLKGSGALPETATKK